MRPIGYLYKRVYVPGGDWPPQVADVYSLSGCLSEDFADYLAYGRYNRYGLFDSPDTIQELAREHSHSLGGLKLFFYEAHEREYDADLRQWVPFAADLDAVIRLPEASTLEGFDVTCFSTGCAPECSPLSCNGLAADLPVNAHCLLPSFDAAIQALESGRFAKSEPGPYRVIAVHSVHSA